jgi:CRP-like cAMP-binding protein
VLPWRDRTAADDADAAAPARYCYVLDVDADLADAFDPRSRLVVRQVATAAVIEVPAGRECPDASTAGSAALGMLLVDGLIALEVQVGDRTATELLGPGDLLQAQPPTVDQLLERLVTRRALTRCRLAILDAEFVDRMRPWPQIILALLQRSEKRAVELNVQRAITSHPSLEVRLALLLWHLAARWGRVESGGVHLELPLTHALLGHLIGAERPSVSRSLARLAAQDLVCGGARDWHLPGSADSCMSALMPRAVESLRGHVDIETRSSA